MKTKINFSVILPVYNTEKYLKKCIESVINQNYENWELLIMDDGSTDNSSSICESYNNYENRIHVFHSRNNGPLKSRCELIKKSQGDYLLFLDSDDYFEDNAFNTINKNIEENNCDCVVFGYNRIQDGKLLYQEKEDSTVLIKDKRELYKKCLLTRKYNSLCRKAIRKTLINNVDYSEYYSSIRYGEDLLQSLDIYKNSKAILFIPDVLYYYRLNEKSATQKMNVKDYKVNFTVREKAFDLVVNENFYEIDKEEYIKFNIENVLFSVTNVLKLNGKYKTKKVILNDIKNTTFYRKLNNHKVHLYGKKRVLHFLYEHGLYSALYVLVICKSLFYNDKL